MPSPERHTTRSIYLDPTGEGDKVQWDAVGAATDWQAVAKGIAPNGGTPSSASGIKTTGTNQLEKFTFPSFAGSLNAGEHVNYIRPWVYMENMPAAAPAYSGAVLADAPLAYYRLGESSGTTATNSATSGATHNGTYVNTPTLGVAGALLDDANTAATFAAASSERVTSTTLGTWGSGALNVTIEFWIKTTNATTRQAVFGSVNTGTAFAIAGWINSAADESTTATQLMFQVRSANGTDHLRAATGPVPIFDDEWHHVVMRVDSASVASIFVDGLTQGLTYSNVGGGVSGGANLGFAMAAAARNNQGTFDNYLDGSLDEVAFYTTRLANDRVVGHFLAGTGGSAGGSAAAAMIGFNGDRALAGLGWVPGNRHPPFLSPYTAPTTGSVGTLQLTSTIEATIPAPQIKGVGAATSGTGAVTPAHPTGPGAPAVGDIKVIVAETAGGEAITVPTGWAHITGSPVDEGTNTRLSVIWKRHASGDTAQSIGDPGNHVIARMFTITGCRKLGNPWDVVNTGTEATSDTSVSYPDATTTVTNTLVFQAVSSGTDVASTTNFTVGSNGNLTSITERADNWTSAGTGGTGGGGFGVLTGIKATASAIGNTTATLGTASSKAMMTVAFAKEDTLFVTAVVAEVGVSTMEHLVVQDGTSTIPGSMVGISTRKPFTGTFAQYGSLAFDNWLVDGSDADIRSIFREMRLHQLDVVRVFVPFGTMMITETIVHEEKFRRLEDTLRLALEENVRVDLTGIVTFAPLSTDFVPPWLDALSRDNRYLTFQRWWRRCAAACAGNPAVIVYDLMNEPLTRNDGGSWYMGTDPWQFAQYISVTFGVGEDEPLIAQFFADTLMSSLGGIRTEDPIKACGFGIDSDHVIPAYVDPGDVALHHAYAFYQRSENLTNVDAEYQNFLKPSGKPLIIEETGAPVDDAQPLKLAEFDGHIALLQRLRPGYVAGGPNWRGAWDSFENRQHTEWVRSAYVFGRWLLREDRLGSPRGPAAKLGQRFR